MKHLICIVFFLLTGLWGITQRGFYRPLPEEDNTEFTELDSLLIRAERSMLNDLQSVPVLAEEIIRVSKEMKSLRREGYGHFYLGMTDMALGWLDRSGA